MRKLTTTLLLICLCQMGYICAQPANNRKAFNLVTYQPHADGKTDDTRAFRTLFEEVSKNNGGTVTIPPGDYYLEGINPLIIISNTHVIAYGANFFLPEKLGDMARITLFEGVDVSNFSWMGGSFTGYCFDPSNLNNTWEPNANTRMLTIHTSEKGKTDNLIFRDITSYKIAGAVINVNGHVAPDNRNKINFATNVTVENCTLLESGKFMWDYGFLWQIIVFPDQYSKEDLNMAYKYFDTTLIFKGIAMNSGSSRIALNNSGTGINVNTQVCFYNDKLPGNIIYGKRYYVVESTPASIKVSDTPNGTPVVFTGSGGADIHLIKDVKRAFFQFAPSGSGPGKGSIDLDGCKNTKITGCKISALGDAMHIHNSQNNIFANNHILGARMGAFFLAEYCKNSTITGNIVDGTNGSRVVSIEKSNENVTVTGNVFRNGGRGCWVNQPRNLVFQGNVFVNNTTKSEKNSPKGRRDFKTGGWQSFPEIYFTTYEENGKYGPVILKDNIFVTGTDAAAAIQFEKNGFDILVEGNVFKGSTGAIMLDENTPTIIIRNNTGATIRRGKQYAGSLFKNE